MQSKKFILYETSLASLALISVILIFLDFSSIIILEKQPYNLIDSAILLVFWLDYVSRLYLSQNKLDFIKKNVLDLIAIIPFNSVFALFRITRIFRIARLTRLSKATRLIRVFGFAGIFNKRIKKFLKTNGFIYMIYASIALILVSSIIMSYIEKQSFSDALWWSIVTCTTVGYGDISPTTGLGRILAVFLMIFGIGFIGMLTSTITTYFANEISSNERKNDSDLYKIIESLDTKQKEELLLVAKLIKKDKRC